MNTEVIEIETSKITLEIDEMAEVYVPPSSLEDIKKRWVVQTQYGETFVVKHERINDLIIDVDWLVKSLDAALKENRELRKVAEALKSDIDYWHKLDADFVKYLKSDEGGLTVALRTSSIVALVEALEK